MTQEEQNIILHTMKGLADARKRFNNYCDELLDMMCHELNVHIPERRVNGERRREYDADKSEEDTKDQTSIDCT